MAQEALKSKHGIVLRATSGALTAADRPLPIFDLDGHRRAIVHIMQEAALATPDADDRVRFLLETAYGAGDFADSAADVAVAAVLGGVPSESVDTINATAVAAFAVGDIIRIDREWMLITGIAALVLTVRRGHRGTPVEAHALAADIFRQDVDWITVANITYDNTDNTLSRQAVVVIGEAGTTPMIADNLEVALADNSVLALPLGDRLRLRTTVAGATPPTYNYSARAAFYN